MVVVYQPNEVLQNLGDKVRLALEESAIPHTYLHILQKNSRVREVRDTCPNISKQEEHGTKSAIPDATIFVNMPISLSDATVFC